MPRPVQEEKVDGTLLQFRDALQRTFNHDWEINHLIEKVKNEKF